jgi:hypothetical protein
MTEVLAGALEEGVKETSSNSNEYWLLVATTRLKALPAAALIFTYCVPLTL